MKKILTFYLLFISIFFVFSSTTDSNSSLLKDENGNYFIFTDGQLKQVQVMDNTIKENPDYSNIKKPIQKVDSFLVVDGGVLETPINVKLLTNCIITALQRHGYQIVSKEPGIIQYKLIKNSFNLTMKIYYNLDEYWYEYVDSTNLDANVSANSIHRSYYRWISILNKEITTSYYTTN